MYLKKGIIDRCPSTPCCLISCVFWSREKTLSLRCCNCTSTVGGTQNMMNHMLMTVLDFVCNKNKLDMIFSLWLWRVCIVLLWKPSFSTYAFAQITRTTRRTLWCISCDLTIIRQYVYIFTIFLNIEWCFFNLKKHLTNSYLHMFSQHVFSLALSVSLISNSNVSFEIFFHPSFFISISEAAVRSVNKNFPIVKSDLIGLGYVN